MYYTVKICVLIFLLVYNISFSYATISIIDKNKSIVQDRLNQLEEMLIIPLSVVAIVSKNNLIEPYKFLLTQPLMTLGIEKYYQRTPIINLIKARINKEENTYSRAITMILDSDKVRNKALTAKNNHQELFVELAFITINLNPLPSKVVDSIMYSNIPFGKLLKKFKISTLSSEQHYFSLKCDKDLSKLLHCRVNDLIYGRINTLIRADNKVWIAKVVEILSGLKCSNKPCDLIPLP